MKRSHIPIKQFRLAPVDGHWELAPANHEHRWAPDPLGGDHTCLIGDIAASDASVFVRHAKRDCPICHGTGYVETREDQGRVISYEPCACRREGQ